MRANSLENKQNPAERSALPEARIRITLVREHRSKGAVAFPQGSLASAWRLPWPLCLSPGLVNCLWQGTCDRRYREEARRRAGRRLGNAICTRSARVERRARPAPALRVHSEIGGAQAGDARLTSFCFIALGMLLRWPRRRRADWTDSQCSLGSRSVRLMRAVDGTG